VIERLLIAFALIALLLVALWAGRRWFERRNANIEARLRATRQQPAVGTAIAPRVIYFNTRTCVVCKNQQEPAIDSLAAHMPDLVVEQYDAVECGQLAHEYGVLSVPTVAVYDRSGELVAINRGFTAASILHAQIEGAEPAFPEGASLVAEPIT
jgi:hypothetical protein